MAHPRIAISKWFLTHQRNLPWRKTHSPYAIWVSEVMLQQTQVTTVIPYYQKFLKAFPHLKALATAPEQKVLSHWAGLGYYSRARNLQKGAQYLLKEHQGEFPREREILLKTPGIGPYTAGAILSIAFDLPVPIVDGNVQRVFSRFLGELREIQDPKVQKRFWEEAEKWVSTAASPRVLNQSIMELGALICKKSSPLCGQCPLVSKCVSYEKGWQDKLPKKKAKRPKVKLHWLGLILEHKEKIFLTPNEKGDWWEGLWDFPKIEVPNKHEVPTALSGVIEKRKIESWKSLGETKHNVTHHQIHCHSYLCRIEKPASVKQWVPRSKKGKWFAKKELANLASSSLVKKVLSHSSV